MAGWDKNRVQKFKAAFNDFLRHVVIVSKEDGECKIVLYDAQKRFLREIFSGLENDIHDFTCLKARQLGISTICRVLIIFWAFIHRGLRVALVFDTESNKEDARKEIQIMLDNLPDSHKIGTGTHNRYQLDFDNGSRLSYFVAGVKKTPSTGGLGRSRGINCAANTECSSWGDVKGLRSYQRSLAQHFHDRLYIWESPLALDTPVPIPSGWTTIGKIKEGDKVYDERGKVCNVIGISPVFVNRKCHKITFGNGDSIISDGVHKWRVMARRWPTNPMWKPKIVTTEEIDPKNHRIEVAKPLDMADILLPVDPYLLGMWLGDGTSGQVAITTGDEDISEMRGQLNQRGIVIGPVSKHNWRVGKFTILRNRSLFMRLGLLGNKHIPEVYMRASENQRRELLAGLMDTDGHISKENFRCEFANVSSRIIEDVAELLASLGIKFHRGFFSARGQLRTFPNGRTYACAAAQRLRFNEHPDMKVFNLSRKKNVQSEQRRFTHRKAKYLKIVSVEEVSSVPVKCISVDTPSHLFLVGKTMIPTHNTANGFANLFYSLWEEAKADELAKRAIFIGWWAKELYAYERDTPLFEKYGTPPITPEEQKRIDEVLSRYGHQVTLEQLAWFRHQDDPNREDDGEEYEGHDMLAQELPWTEDEAFLLSGSQFFPSVKLTEARKEAGKHRITGFNYYMTQNFTETIIEPAKNPRLAWLKTWDEPDPMGVYAVGCDPAYGSSEDSYNSVAQVMRCYADGVEQVAEFCAVEPDTSQFAWAILHLCGAYGNCRFMLELNGPGHAVWNEIKSIKNLMAIGYLRDIAEEKGLTSIFRNVREYVWAKEDSLNRNPSAFHWETNTKRKVQIFERMKALFNTNQVIIKSTSCLEEMKKVVRDGDTIKGEGVAKYDRVMAMALAIRAWEDGERRTLITQGRTKDIEQKKREFTTYDLQKIWSEGIVGDFFNQQRSGRLQAKRAARRAGRWDW